jgi:selenocysteine-specific elongation factor
VEHLQILDLLRVSRGAAVITKIDRVGEDELAQVSENVQALLAGTSLEGAPVMPVSAASGAGMPELRALLEREAAQAAARHSEGEHFRLAIDRVFTVAGSGTSTAACAQATSWSSRLPDRKQGCAACRSAARRPTRPAQASAARSI